MIHDSVQIDIAKATVRLLNKGGQGVLVHGNVILTAAHCIDYSCEGEMILGKPYIEEIESEDGNLKVEVLAVEPVSDIAVLSEVNVEELFEEVEKFREFCNKTKPLTLCTREFDAFQSFPVYIYTHERQWMTAKAEPCGEFATSFLVEADGQIEGGTSGGPIVNEEGELVGIASNFSFDLEDTSGQSPSDGSVSRPHLALPVWTWNAIRSAQGCSS